MTGCIDALWRLHSWSMTGCSVERNKPARLPASRYGMLRSVEIRYQAPTVHPVKDASLRDAGWDAGKFHSTERFIPTE
jgi:hypothetical protein